jgi:hypothetical protein
LERFRLKDIDPSQVICRHRNDGGIFYGNLGFYEMTNVQGPRSKETPMKKIQDGGGTGKRDKSADCADYADRVFTLMTDGMEVCDSTSK